MVLLLFVLLPIVMNISTRYRYINNLDRVKIYFILANLVVFHGFLYFMTYKTDFGILVKYSLFWNMLVLFIYDAAIRNLNEIR